MTVTTFPIFLIANREIRDCRPLTKASPAEIRAIYVLPSHQGKGFGAKLLHFLESKLVALGVKEIMLGASLNAQAFYARHDYLPGLPGALEMSGVSIPYILMTKTLR